MKVYTATLTNSQNLQQKSPPQNPSYMPNKFHFQSNPPRPHRQVRLTRSKTKDNTTPPPYGAHEGGNEQGAPAQNFLHPAQAPGSLT